MASCFAHLYDEDFVRRTEEQVGALRQAARAGCEIEAATLARAGRSGHAVDQVLGDWFPGFPDQL